jgi:hypothetical protein
VLDSGVWATSAVADVSWCDEGKDVTTHDGLTVSILKFVFSAVHRPGCLLCWLDNSVAREVLLDGFAPHRDDRRRGEGSLSSVGCSEVKRSHFLLVYRKLF